jgi:hypothetical protein
MLTNAGSQAGSNTNVELSFMGSQIELDGISFRTPSRAKDTVAWLRHCGRKRLSELRSEKTFSRQDVL